MKVFLKFSGWLKVFLKFSRQVKVFRTGERSCVPSLRLSLLRESGTWLRTTVAVSSQTREVSSITQITLSPTAGPTKLCFFLSHHTVPIRFECGLVLAEAELDCVPWYLPQVWKMSSLFVKPVWLSTQPGRYYIDSLWKGENSRTCDPWTSKNFTDLMSNYTVEASQLQKMI